MCKNVAASALMSIAVTAMYLLGAFLSVGNVLSCRRVLGGLGGVKISVESINYQISNCVVELLFGALFGVFSILALLNVLPLDAVMFFLIPCVFIIGWCFVKFHTTPEVLTLTSEGLEYRRGRKFIFKEKFIWMRVRCSGYSMINFLSFIIAMVRSVHFLIDI